MDRTKLRDELIRDEGLRLQAYKDSLGYWTIGVGHLLGQHARMTVITHAEARALLEADIDEAIERARKYAPGAEGDEVRWRAIVNMAFNLGDKLGQFKRFLAAVEVKDWVSASVHMLDSKWAGQVGERARRLSKMILTGIVL